MLLLTTSRLASAQDDTLGGWRPHDLIDAVASFGAVGLDGALYVYGGHVGRVGRSNRRHALARLPGGTRHQRQPRRAASLTWSDDTVTWRTTTPGFGQSSPVVWDDTVFLTSLEGVMKQTIFVTALDLEDGSERWSRRFDAAEAFEWNDYVSKGAPTPAVDGERLYAFFDSGDLMALTHDGDTVWHRDLGADYGTVGGNHGVGNSVLLTDDAVVITSLAYDW